MPMAHRLDAGFFGTFWLVTNISVNPARSTGPALFVGSWALAQLWLFWVAPPAGAVIGGLAYKWLGGVVKVVDAVPRPAAPAE